MALLITDSTIAGNQVTGMQSPTGNIVKSAEPPPGTGFPIADFDTIYEETVDFVWRTVRRMGVRGADTDDVVQEVFVIVHRRLAEFEGRAQLKTWLFKILVHVVQHYFRTHERKPGDHATETGTEIQALMANQERGPAGELERMEALRVLDRLLSRLDDEKRVVFVLAEIEQMTLVEIAEVVEANANTVGSRLRAARKDFEKALSRFQARELGKKP
jgi:RNA polymerase sigma-70 factor, ECF subfamily